MFIYKHYTRGDEEECREGTIPWQTLPLKGSICVLTTFLAERCCWCYDIEQNYWATWGRIMIFLCDIFGAVVTRLCKHSSCLFNLILASTRERERHSDEMRWCSIKRREAKIHKICWWCSGQSIIELNLFDNLMLEIQYTALHETLSTALEGVWVTFYMVWNFLTPICGSHLTAPGFTTLDN